jgi:hypothetical protein
MRARQELPNSIKPNVLPLAVKSSRILVLGNDPQINDIEFDRLAPDVITLGVNRIWLKHIPTYYFFNDYDILQELCQHQERLLSIQSNSKCFSSDWLAQQARKAQLRVPGWVTVHPRGAKKGFPDSASTAIHLFLQCYLPGTPKTFYLAGISLKWKEPSHFWKVDEYDARNRHGEEWYRPRFERMYDNFKSLRDVGTKMVSVHPDSRLNSILRYENISNLYAKSTRDLNGLRK